MWLSFFTIQWLREVPCLPIQVNYDVCGIYSTTPWKASPVQVPLSRMEEAQGECCPLCIVPWICKLYPARVALKEVSVKLCSLRVASLRCSQCWRRTTGIRKTVQFAFRTPPKNEPLDCVHTLQCLMSQMRKSGLWFLWTDLEWEGWLQVLRVWLLHIIQMPSPCV